MTNQSFTEFKLKKRQLEAEIMRLCNEFSDEFGVRVASIQIDSYTHQVGKESPNIILLKVETEI